MNDLFLLIGVLSLVIALLVWQFIDLQRKLNRSLDAHRDTLVKQGEQLHAGFEVLHQYLDAKQEMNLLRQKLQRYTDVFGELEYDPDQNDDDDLDDEEDESDDDHLNDHY